MSFRERTAWITLLTIVICFGVYYGAILTGLAPGGTWASFHLGVLCFGSFVLLQVGLNVAAALINPKDARTPRDERERLIHARSHIIGYYVLMIGMAAVLIATHIPMHGGGKLDVIINTVNFGAFVMILAALSVAISQIVMYRRGH